MQTTRSVITVHMFTQIFREGAFSGLDSLEWLKLEDNAISALAGGDLFPASLKVLFQNISKFENVRPVSTQFDITTLLIPPC